jgi:hypothetical protein
MPYMAQMKTTLDLPDDLLREAKVVAARRKTTLKDLVTRSLRAKSAWVPLRDPASMICLRLALSASCGSSGAMEPLRLKPSELCSRRLTKKMLAE